MLLSRLEPAPAKKGRWLVHLENGTTLAVTEAELVTFSLYTGMELDGQTLSGLAAAARVSNVRERALSLISMRPLSRAELISKLTQKGEAAENLEAVADWLEQLGLLSDAEYARTVVRHYAAKCYGIYKIKGELYRRGVPKDIWEDALTELDEPNIAIDDYLKRNLKDAADCRQLKKCTDALSRRGFSYSDIRDGLRRCSIELEEE